MEQPRAVESILYGRARFVTRRFPSEEHQMGRAHHATSAALALVASLSLSSTARAQQTPAATAAPATSTRSNAPRIGYVVESPKPEPTRAAASQPGVVTPPVYYYTNDGYVVPAPTYLVLDDGSVLVNFGNGYERVLRSCASLRPAPVARDPFGRDALGNMPDPPGIAAMKAGSRGQASGISPARDMVACYNADGQGRLRVTAP
jgi:hypothetical protein